MLTMVHLFIVDQVTVSIFHQKLKTSKSQNQLTGTLTTLVVRSIVL